MASAAYPDLLEHLATTVAERLAARGIDPVTATELGNEAAEAVRQTFGGQPIYIAKGVRWLLSQRDREIYAKWTGRNAWALCREHDITERRLRQIIDAMREADRRERQEGLFDDAAG